MYFFIMLCLYSQVCIEFFLCVFGLVLALQCLHSHARHPPARHPPHHRLLGYQGVAFLQCALLVATTLCALLIWRHACPLPPHAPHAGSSWRPRSSWRPLTFDSSLLICFCSACTSDAACWLRRPPVRRRALRESTTSCSCLIVLALSVSLHRSNIIFASALPATNSFHLFTRDNKEWKIEQRQHTPLGLLQLELARERCVLYSEAHQERVVAGMRQGLADVGAAGTIADEHIMRNCP